MFTIAQLLILFAAVLGSGVMVAFLGFLLGRIRRLEQGSPKALSQQIAALQGDLDSIARATTALEERVDFAERLLTEGRGSRTGIAGGDDHA